MDPEFFARAFNSSNFLEWNKHNSEVALALVQCVKEIGGASSLQQMDPEFFKRVFYSSDFRELRWDV